MDKPGVAIRYGTQDDAGMLAEIGAQSFSDTFAADNTPEDMASYLAASFSLEKQAAELADPHSVFLIAEVDGQTAGYAKLHAGQPGPGVVGASPIELVRIYALHGWIGQGVGAALMQACLDEAARGGHDLVWLGVWERNTRAQAFYRKWGFTVTGTQTFLLGADLQTDFVMQKFL